MAFIRRQKVDQRHSDAEAEGLFGVDQITVLGSAISVIAAEMVVNKMKVDPAVASAVVLTAITDVVGFLSFLALAALVLL